MENCSHRPKDRLLKIVALIAIAIIAVFAVTDRSRNRVALGELGRGTAELRAQLEERDRLISSLQADLQQVQSQMRAAPESNRSKVIPLDTTDSRLAQRVAELGVQLSNTAVVVERLVAMIPDTEAPAQSAQRSKTLLPALEVSAQEEQRKWELAGQKAAELLTNLNVPPEAAMIPPNQALDNVDLRAYWPFFEAKKERDVQQRIAEAVRMKLITERIESGAEAVTNRSQ
jgi:hypothetical protein